MMERDEIERYLKGVLEAAYFPATLDADVAIDIDGPFAILSVYSLDDAPGDGWHEGDIPTEQYRIAFDIQRVGEAL